ncbi:MAG: VCBS repeat-containing protein [Bacteroidia bacterium]|nr:VCBS repeat-containing protein [Bacteroidia bacterium]MBT8310799.1 VCBS repeat-containing protein [Bacteroidia bacterium]NNK29041.1 T9SS type A sorting domain-containing protein [Flavobacteriaceae bacterium]NNL60219.1 T9SS type A sorting domain-containing protein [Flavobacteriaceae bacterium]
MNSRITLFIFSLITLSSINAQVSFSAGTSLSSFSGGQSCIVDMNNDQLDDIVRVSSSQINILFQTASGFTEQSFTPSPQQQNSPSWSIAAGDINADGFNDLLLGGGSSVSFIYNNDAASFSADNSQTDYIFSQRSTFADINNDGHLDAFVCHDVDQSHPYKNNGSGVLDEDQSLIVTADLAGNYAAVWVDYDNDRDIDLYITKCRQGSSHGDIERVNLMYRNNGDGTFTEVAGSLGIADGEQSWITVFDDLDNDGDMDAFVLNHYSGSEADNSNRYYRNNLMETGTADFTDIIGLTGIAANDLGAWEANVGDFDNDGDLDILSELGKELYLNNGNNSFTGQDLSLDEGAIGDVDDDGDLDVVYYNTLYTNNTSNSNDWIKINTIGIQSNRNGIGARIEATGSFGKQIREVRSGHGFGHMSSLSTHFGFGATEVGRASVDAITIYWPSGTVDIIPNPTLNTTLTVTEGEYSLSVEEALTDDLIIYPNPTNNILNLSYPEQLQNPVYSVFNISGKRVMNAKLNSNSIDVSGLSSGNYILRLISEGKIQYQKFIKQ